MLRIDLQRTQSPVLKIGFGFMVLFYGITCITLWVVSYLMIDREPIQALIMMSLGILLFIVGKRYLSNTFFKEYIQLEDDRLTLYYRSMGKNTQVNFPLSSIKSIQFVGFDHFTEHPLNFKNFDYLGLSTTQKEVHKIISSGTMEIITDSGSYRFGKEIPSWEAERVMEEIRNFQQHQTS